MAYTSITPAQGCDGKWYVDAHGRDNFQGCHLDHERERGNLRQVVKLFEVCFEKEIPDGALVCLGDRVTVWKEVE